MSVEGVPSAEAIDTLFDGDRFATFSTDESRHEWLIGPDGMLFNYPINFNSPEEFAALSEYDQERYLEAMDALRPRIVEQIGEKLADFIHQVDMEERHEERRIRD